MKQSRQVSLTVFPRQALNTDRLVEDFHGCADSLPLRFLPLKALHSFELPETCSPWYYISTTDLGDGSHRLHPDVGLPYSALDAVQVSIFRTTYDVNRSFKWLTHVVFRPIWHYWTLFADWGNCISEWPPLAGQGITTVLTDIAVYLLPMPTLFRLQMPRSQRISLIILFGLGTVVVIAGIMRTYWVLRVEIRYVEDPSYDLTWDGFNIWVWTALEANLAIVCGCAPTLRRLFTTGKEASQPVNNSIMTIGSSGWRKNKGSKGLSQGTQDEDVEEHVLTNFESRGTNEASVTKSVDIQEHHHT